MKNQIVALFALAGAGMASVAVGQSIAPITGTSYSQNFDTLAFSGNPAWNNNTGSPLLGWSVYRTNSGGVNSIRDSSTNNSTAYVAGDGSSSTGALYSFGSAGSSERALGTVASGPTGDFNTLLILRNDTGLTINTFTLEYTLEQWRQGGQTTGSPALGTQHRLVLDYTIRANTILGDADASNIASRTFPAGNWDGVGPIGTVATASALDGNAAANRATGRGGTTPGVGLNWAPGALLIIRWWDDNNTGNDHGLAIDDVTVTIPTPGAAALAAFGLVAAGRRRR